MWPCGSPDPPAPGPCGTQKSTGLVVCPPFPWPGVRCADTTELHPLPGQGAPRGAGSDATFLRAYPVFR